MEPAQLFAAPFPDVGSFSPALASQLEVVTTLEEKYNKNDPDSSKIVKASPVALRTRAALQRRAQGPLNSPSLSIAAAQRSAEAASAPSLDIDSFQFDESTATPPRQVGRAVPPPANVLTFEQPLSPTSPAFNDPSDVSNDEQTVNCALYLFLMALCMHHPEVRNIWTMHRLGFHMHVYFEARTDGYLKSQHSARISAILEVKRYRRGTNEHAVQMQESAQVAAWISDRPQDYFVPSGKKKGRKGDLKYDINATIRISLPYLSRSPFRFLKPLRTLTKGEENSSFLLEDCESDYPTSSRCRCRLLISQDYDDIFLTFAEYGPAYEDYLSGKQSKSATDAADEADFLVMHHYGPWSTGDVKQLKYLSRFILAFVLMLSKEGATARRLFGG